MHLVRAEAINKDSSAIDAEYFAKRKEEAAAKAAAKSAFKEKAAQFASK